MVSRKLRQTNVAKAMTRPVFGHSRGVDYAGAAMKLKLRFDNEGDTPARFSAFYLLGRDEHELIRLLNH